MFPQTTADEQEQGLTTDVEEEYEADSFQPEEAFARLWVWEKLVLETSGYVFPVRTHNQMNEACLVILFRVAITNSARSSWALSLPSGDAARASAV